MTVKCRLVHSEDIAPLDFKQEFDDVIEHRRRDTDEFYSKVRVAICVDRNRKVIKWLFQVLPSSFSSDEIEVAKQAYAGDKSTAVRVTHCWLSVALQWCLWWQVCFGTNSFSVSTEKIGWRNVDELSTKTGRTCWTVMLCPCQINGSFHGSVILGQLM